ncbi:MAG: translocation/assembly module TamB domain-containing protein, partial [Planctomycetota bacterium]
MRRRRVLRILLVVCLVLVVLVAAAPWLAGFGFVRGYVAAQLATALGRSVELDDLEAGWMSGVALRGLSVANRTAEFGEEAMVEASSVRVDDSLTQLLFGGGPSRVVVEGLVVRVAEQAGGRTNIDDLLADLAAAPPPEKVEVEVKEVRPLRVELRDCTVQLRRLPYRPPPHPFDPFEADPVVVPADEGAVVFGLDRFDLVLETGRETRLRFDGGVTVDGKGGRLAGSVRIAGGKIEGTVQTHAFDLELLRPFFPGDLRGKMDLAAEGDLAGGIRFGLKVKAFHLAGERLPTVTEEWIELKGTLREEGKSVVVETLAFTTASGDVELEGAGSWPLQEGRPFRLRAGFPSHLVFAPTGREPIRGRFRLQLDGKAEADGFDVVGKVTSHEFVFLAPELAKLGPGESSLDFDLGLRGKRLEIRRLEHKGHRLDLNLNGTACLTQPFDCDVKGRVSLDLELAHRLFQPFLQLDEKARIRGRVAISNLAMRVDAKGNGSVKADAEVDDLLVAGLLREDLQRKHAELHVDLVVEDEGNALRVRKGRLDDLQATGYVVGLTEDDVRHAEGEVKGSVRLDSLPVQLAGIDEIDALAGLLTVDARARTDARGVHVEGTVQLDDPSVEGFDGVAAGGAQLTVAGRADRIKDGRWQAKTTGTLKGLRLRAPFGDVDGNVALDLRATEETEGGRVEGEVKLKDLRAAGGFGELRRDRVTLHGWVGGAPDRLSGDVTVRGDFFTLTAALEESARARLLVSLDDVERLPELGLELPAALELDGPVTLRGDLRREGGVWAFGGGLNSGQLTVRWDERGLAGEPVTLTFKGREEKGGWAIEMPTCEAERSRAWLKLVRGFVDRDGHLRAEVQLGASLDHLGSVLPDLAALQPSGVLSATTTVTYDGDWSFDLAAEGKGVRATIDGKRTASRDFGLQTRARLGAGGVQLETVRLVVDQTEFTGAGRIGRGVELTLSGHGPVDALTAFVPSLAGKGTLDLQDVKVHLREDDTVRLSGRVAVEELSLADAQVVRPRLRFQVDARVDGPNLRDLETDLLLTAVEAAYDTVH